jgi:RNA polymerase sigma-70 factor (ECF subfamily)
VTGDPLDLLSDEQLVALTQSGDPEAFNRLAARWQGPLYGFVLRTMGNAEEAKDVVQEALVKAHGNLPRLREGAKFKSWLHNIALNLCRDRFRAAKVRGKTISLEDAGESVAQFVASETAEQGAESGSLQGVLEGFLEKLPVEQRTCLLLREVHGFNSEEISEITGTPSATVRTRIFYGLKAVRKQMDKRGLTAADFR